MVDKKKLLQDFEYTLNLAELKALSKVSLERELTEAEYGRIMFLKNKIFK